MNDDLKNAIDVLAKKITAEISPLDALQFTQAALNLAHTAATLDAVERAKQ